MNFPDFAFHANMQAILFFVNCMITTLTYYWGVNIVMQIYGRDILLKRKLLFSASSAIIFLLITYVFVLVKIIFPDYAPFINQFGVFFRLMLPLSYYILYLMGIRILKLSSYKSIKIMQLFYIYYICCSFILKIVRRFLFPSLSEQRGYNFMQDIFMLVSGTVVTYIFYRIVSYFVNKYKMHIDFSDNIIIIDVHSELQKNFIICCVFYGIAIISYHFTLLNGFYYIALLIIYCGYIAISILIDYMDIYRGRLINKDEHITALSESIEDFRGVKHDIDNILQSYGGYLDLGDLKKLKKYHQKVVSTVITTEMNLDLSQQLPQNPSFFALIKNKMNKAHQYNVNLQLVLCNMQEVYIDELDFNRIMAILIDNAIEAAAQTLTRQISIMGQIKPDHSKLFILSNDTTQDVTIDELFLPGFTTKPGHMGRGLSQIQTILHKYGNTTFNITCYRNTFTAYLELKPNNRLAFAKNEFV